MYCTFQYEILDIVLYLNVFFFKFGKFKSELRPFASHQRKQMFIYLVNLYVNNTRETQLRSSFQVISLSQQSARECHSLFHRYQHLAFSTNKSLFTINNVDKSLSFSAYKSNIKNLTEI